MPRPATTLDDVLAYFEHLQSRVDLISSVVNKFPIESLPERLRAFVNPPVVVTTSPTRTPAGELRLQVSGRSWMTHSFVIPESWLKLQDSQLSKHIRELYWSERKSQEVIDQTRLATLALEHEQQAATHAKKADSARAELDQIAAKAQARAKARADRARGAREVPSQPKSD